MTIGRYVRLFAGSFVMLSLALGAPASPVFQNQNWLWFTGFVGLMMAQSALTGFCPMAIGPRTSGSRRCAGSGRRRGWSAMSRARRAAEAFPA